MGGAAFRDEIMGGENTALALVGRFPLPIAVHISDRALTMELDSHFWWGGHFVCHIATHMDIPEVKRRYRTIHGLKVNIITDLLTYWNL